MTEVTIPEMNDLITMLYEEKAKKKALEEQVKAINKDIIVISSKLIDILKQHNMKSHTAPAGGVSIKRVYSVKTPKTDEDKKALFDWLTEHEKFLHYATVHSRSLQKLYNTELEEATRRGEGMDFAIPGIGAPTMFETLNSLKGNKDDDDSNDEE